MMGGPVWGRVARSKFGSKKSTPSRVDRRKALAKLLPMQREDFAGLFCLASTIPTGALATAYEEADGASIPAKPITLPASEAERCDAGVSMMPEVTGIGA